MKTKIFTLLFSIVAGINMLFAASGTCGYHLTWDLTDGVLIICGFGDMKDYTTSDSNHAPWYNYRKSITSLSLPDGLTSIGSYAFIDCSGLTSVTIPDSVTSIGSSAFSDCSGLISVTIPNSVTSIGSYAFSSCSGLTSMSIPDSVTSIGSYVFRGCSELNTIIVENGNPVYDSRYECNAIIETATNALIVGCKNTIIPESVTRIRSYAFTDCSKLASVIIPESVTNIGSGTFSSCSGLNSIIVENGNPVYDSRNGCNAIIETATNALIVGCKNTIIPESVTSIGSFAFHGCSSLTSVIIPNRVTSVGYYAFRDCTGLTSVIIPDSVTNIGSYAFYGCSDLTSVTVPKSITSIGNSAFTDCSKLASVTLNSNAIASKTYTALSNLGTIFGTQVEEYIIGDSVTSIGSCAFYGCSGLTSVTIPNSVTNIGSSAFSDCSSLSSFTIPSGVTSIGSYAFYNCSGLTLITIETDTPPSLGSNALSNTNNCPIYVPCGTLEAYKSAWSGSSRIKYKPFEYTISGEVNMAEWGSLLIPQNTCEGDSITAIPNYGYHFVQWNDGVATNPRTIKLTKDTTFTAEFAKNTYIVSKVTDTTKGCISGVAQAEYLDTVILTAIPNVGYHFVQWLDDVTDNPRSIILTKDTTLTALFAINQYTITWKNDDGSTIEQTTAEYGQIPTHIAPTKEATAQYTYTFTGWTPEIVAATDDATYTAAFDSVVNKYTISFKNGEQVLQSTEVEYGQVPAYNGVTPVKQATAQYTYTFAGWTPEIVPISGDATYTATYDSIINKYTITFKNGEQVLQSTEVEYGQVPAYNGVTPTKETTAQYTYTFDGWSPNIVAVGGEATYIATFKSTINSYTITWKNDDASMLDQTIVEYGQTPAHANPTKAATAQYTYTFTRWTPEIVSVSGDATYTATFDSIVNKYTITFKNGEQELQSTEVEYGQMPAYNGTTPTKPADAQYSYTFAGWSPEMATVTGNATYYATFNAIVNKYTIIFKNGEQELQSSEVEYGQVPSYNGVTPVKQATTQYTYTFMGWTPEIVSVSDDAIYTAAFDSIVNKYAITFKNGEEELQSTEVEYGQMPAYNGTTPTKSADAQYTYTFAGWSPEIVTVTGAATYSAVFNASVNKYTIVWKQDDGSIIDQTTVEYGQIPAHADPSKMATAEFTYTFAGWSPNIVAVTSDAIYTATYTSTRNSYTITWKNDDGSTIDQTIVEYGQVPSHAEPTKTATAQYTYAFAGWSPNIAAVTGDATYTATFNAMVRKYTIAFLDDDGSLISQQSVEYGKIPQQEGPSKPSTAKYTYIFAGWTPEVVAVTGNATYTATYTTILRKYTITFLNDDGTILSDDQWNYGEMPSCEEPTKEDDEQYTYTFAGWTPGIVAVIGEATYTATYTATAKPEGIDDVETDIPVQKIFRDGQIFILRGEKVYTLQGQEVR